MTQNEEPQREELVLSTGLCAACGKPTSSALVAEVADGETPEHNEPFICNRCIVEIKKEVYTELEVRNRVSALESKVNGLETRVWILSILFSFFGIVIGFVLGAALGP